LEYSQGGTLMWIFSCVHKKVKQILIDRASVVFFCKQKFQKTRKVKSWKVFFFENFWTFLFTISFFFIVLYLLNLGISTGEKWKIEKIFFVDTYFLDRRDVSVIYSTGNYNFHQYGGYQDKWVRAKYALLIKALNNTVAQSELYLDPLLLRTSMTIFSHPSSRSRKVAAAMGWSRMMSKDWHNPSQRRQQ
jgi:hypothetical protein